MSKLVPSPDWFVGLDSLDLCKNGRFVDSVKIEVGNLFAYSDSILEFEWVNEYIYQNSFCNHSSFSLTI